MKVTIDIGEIGEARVEAAVAGLRGVKTWYEQAGDKRLKAGEMTLAQVSERLQPIGDAINLCGLVSLAMAEASEPGLDEVQEYAGLMQVCPGVTLAGPKAVARENAEACGDCRVPLCRFCGQPGGRSGGMKDAGGKIVERYYVCQTPGCIAARDMTPQPAKLFSGGN